MHNSSLGALLLLALASPAAAQSTEPRPPLFTRSDAIWAGAALLGSVALSTADVRIAGMWNDSTHRNAGRDRLARNFAKAQEGTLFVGNMALWGIARLAKMPAMADVTFHAAQAVFVGSLAAQVIRGPLGRSRPHVTQFEDQYDFKPFRGFRDFDHRAFPSIHTASAFAVATIYTMETKRRAPGATWIVGPIAYALALGPGVSRMYTGQHWASDVLGGAFMGTFVAAKLMKYNHEVRPENRVNKFFLGARNVQVGVSSSGFSATYARRF
ncbi:MAG TPA: phosphatase PAP2 family protein [Gemmatimonadaceae bacterium]|nr:phosphatase PAP2 family protein [Gemmatimonadaceae bacterium]